MSREGYYDTKYEPCVRVRMADDDCGRDHGIEVSIGKTTKPILVGLISSEVSVLNVFYWVWPNDRLSSFGIRALGEIVGLSSVNLRL